MFINPNKIDPPKLDRDFPDEESLKSNRFSTFFEVSHPAYDNKLSLNSFWLRCHCRCSICYDSIKCRKKINFMDIPSEIHPKSVEQMDDMSALTLEWDDGHKSQYDINFLFNSQIVKEPATFHRIPWYKDSDDIIEYTPIEFNALVSFDENIEFIFHNLSQHGVAIVENIPTQSNAMAKLALCRLFPHLQTTHFEELNESHSDISTNLTYSSADCGLKCFFIVENVDIILVDGLNVAHDLRALNDSAFKTLSQVKVPLEISNDNVKCHITEPVIVVDPETEEILHFRLDVHRMGVLNTLPQEKVEEFYDSLREMIKIIQTKENQWVISSKPGTMIILDNSRVFHKVCASSGISQCCLDKKDYVSRMRYVGST